jgi:hypothetical protein
MADLTPIHPCHTVNPCVGRQFTNEATASLVTGTWYECLKWCNARSPKEGLAPAYYTTAGMTNVYKSGSLAIMHPAINGKTLTTHTVDVPTGETHGALYAIETEGEAVAGAWVIDILHDGGVLSREEFTLVTQREVGP